MDDYEDEAPTPASPLAQLQGEITDPAARDAIGEAITHIDNHLQQARIADENTAVGQNFINDWQSFGNGLTSWVQGDPTALTAALDAVPPVARGMVGTIPGLDPDAAQQHHDAIVADLQKQIATAAIRRTAEDHAGLTAELLGNERIQGLLSEDDRHNLAAYATHQAEARDRDQYSQAIEQQRQRAEAVDRRGMDFLMSLHDPQAGGEAFPPNWHQQLVADPSIPVENKGILADAYGKLRVRGDAPNSDPFTIGGLADAIASGQKPAAVDLAQAVTADNLRVQDAVHLAALSPQEASALSATLQSAKAYLMGRDGENGAAGVSAYGRFTNWMMGAYRQAGPGSLNPNADTFVLGDGAALRSFYPSGDDILRVDYAQNGPGEGFAPRRPLGEIFGKSRLTPDSIDPAVRMFGGYGTLQSNEDNLVPGRLPSTLRGLPNTGEAALEGGGGNADTVIRTPPEPITDAMPRVSGQTDTLQGSPQRVFHSRGVNHPRKI